MAITVGAVMRHVRNFFVRSVSEGEYTISGGVVTPAVSAPFVAISGSAYHDGVHRLDLSQIVDDHLPDETFTGRVWLLHPPNDFLALCEEISAFDAKSPAGALQSESFGDYSYARAAGSTGVLAWEQVFSVRLTPYRRMFTEVDV